MLPHEKLAAWLADAVMLAESCGYELAAQGGNDKTCCPMGALLLLLRYRKRSELNATASRYPNSYTVFHELFHSTGDPLAASFLTTIDIQLFMNGFDRGRYLIDDGDDVSTGTINPFYRLGMIYRERAQKKLKRSQKPVNPQHT